jgi:succinoglycan biosynthesis transport protein ExoP
MSHTPHAASPSAPPARFGADSISSTLRRELWIVSRSRGLIGIVMGGAILIATIYNYGTRPLYESVSVISLDRAADALLNPAAPVDAGRMQDALQEQVRRLRSPELVLRSVEDATPEVKAELALGPLGDWKERIRSEVSHRLRPPKSGVASVPEMVEALRSRLAVEHTPPAKWVYVRFWGYDAEATATALNRLIDVYLRDAAKEAEGASGATRSAMKSKVAERQGQVADSLDQLDAFEAKEGLKNVEGRRELLAKELARLQDALISARQARQSRLAIFEESQKASTSEMLSIPSVREDREVSETGSRISDLESKVARSAAVYGDLHPELAALRSELGLARQRLSARLATLRDSIARDYRLAQREERDLGAAVADAQRSLSQLERNSVEHSFIQRQALAGQQAVGELIEKSVREADQQVYFAPRVLQQATPATVPVSPQRGRNFQIALALGGILALSLAWLRAHLDETVRTPDDARLHFDLPMMGMIPRDVAAGADMFARAEGPSSRLLEAYRLLRTNVMMGPARPGGHRVLLITSSREGEGKTTTSRGLATALARAGNRVLLIDGDLRRASLSRLLQAEGRAGLVEVIEGEKASACVTPTAVPGLALLPAGRHHEDAAELLNREVLTRTCEALRTEYDWIVIDAPPVLAVADAAVLCRVADAVLVVVGANVTPIASIRATLEQLAAVRASIAGLVLNNVDLDRDSHYYRHYYSSQYEDYSSGTKRGRVAPAAAGSRARRPAAEPRRGGRVL